jgi:2'-hydroxyisoflavone reductase
MRMTRRDWIKLSGTALMGASALGAATRSLAFGSGASAGKPKPMRLLILGGTGFIGPHQVRYALERGHHVTIFNRGKEHVQWPGPVEELLGDRNTGDLKSLEGGEWDVCIDNPTTLPFWVRDAGKVLKGRVKHYIFISTISVYAENKTPNADESAAVAPYTGSDAMAETLETLHKTGELYGPLKALSEQEAEKQFPGHTTIIRPGLIVGPGDETDRFTYWPVRLSKGGEVLAPGDGSDPTQIIDARDLAAWTIRMAEARKIGTFNATGPAKPLVMRDLLGGVKAGIHSDAKLEWVPTDFLEAEKVEMWSDMPAWIPGRGEMAGFGQRNIQRALAAGLTFRPLTQTAADTLVWFKEQPAERQEKMHAGIQPEREKQVLAKWHATQKG